MYSKFSFYLEQENNLFGGRVLAVCYKADFDEIKEFGLTSENVLFLIKNKGLDNIHSKNNIDYFDEIKRMFHKKNIFLRIQSECLLGIYGDSHCDCESQRLDAIKLLSQNDGIFVHMPQEGQGWGLHYKLKELELQVSGHNENGEYIGEKNRDDAQKILIGNIKFNDFRGYGIIAKILKFLDLNREQFILISESEKKISTLREFNLNITKLSDYSEKNINSENISEYLIKILNGTHTYDKTTIDKLSELIIERKYNGRTLSTLTKIVDKIKTDKSYNISPKLKEKLLDAYDKIICGDEKRYIVDDSVIKLQNNFSCKVNSSVFKAIQNLYGKNVFDRISLEKMYYFENKTKNESIRVRTSRVLNTIGDKCIFIKGQIHVEQKTFNSERTQIFQDEISLSKLRSFFENNNYDYVKRVEMITMISEKQLPGINIYIKKLPTIENRIMDVYGKKENIQKFINDLAHSLSRNVLNEVVSNSDYEDENFTDYNLRFADLDAAINEELATYELLIDRGDE